MKTKIVVTFDSDSDKEEFSEWLLELVDDVSGFSISKNKKGELHVEKDSHWSGLNDF